MAWSAYRFGWRLDSATNITMNSNFLGHVLERDLGGVVIDQQAMFAICSWEGSRCKDVFLTHNIAAGGPYAGFLTPMHECGESET